MDFWLKSEDYTIKNALLWGNFSAHFKKCTQGKLSDRVVHLAFMIIQLLPIISQIASFAERFLAKEIFLPEIEKQSKLANRISKGLSKKGVPPHEKEEPLRESFTLLKERLLSQLQEEILKQRANKTYKRNSLELLSSENANTPIEISNPPEKITSFVKNSTFYCYNSEGIRDHGWGCAWRTLQTCLSTYKIKAKFEELFHLFGVRDTLVSLYEDKYPDKKLLSKKAFAPFELASGWAEPFIGEMAMHFYGIDSKLERLNGRSTSCNAPEEVMHRDPVDFKQFKEKLENHFSSETPAPVMIDDGTYTLNIVGIGFEPTQTTLWIADPHVKEKASWEPGTSPVGLYTVTLDNEGKQIDCSVGNKDQHQAAQLFSSSSYQGLHFDKKKWVVLFPKEIS